MSQSVAAGSENLHQEFQLGEWHVTPLRGVIHGKNGSRRLTPKAMNVLLCLTRHHGEVASREAILSEVWHGRATSDEPLNKCIAELRRQLGDNRSEPSFIETIPKRGYRLIAPCVPVGERAAEQTGGFGADTSATRKVIWGIAAALLVGLVVSIAAWRASTDSALADTVAIAVLPFDSLSESGAREYFADGIQEELIGVLSRNTSLDVRSRTSTMQYRGSKRPLPEIAAELQANVIVEGSVRQEGQSIRVNAQLVRASDDSHLWSGKFDRTLSVADLFAVQNEIAREIAQALHLTLGAEPATDAAGMPTDNVAAYDHFILGKYHYRRQLPGDLKLAVENFEAAVALDSQFADAWDWLAYAYNHAATVAGYLPPAVAYPKGRAAALRALEIRPQLATALSILGYIRAVYDRDWTGAEADLLKANTLAPDDTGTVWSLAHVYALIGRHDEAVALVRNLAEKEPSTGRQHHEHANRLLDARRYDEALQALAVAASLGDDPAQNADARGVALLGLGRWAESLEAFRFAVRGRQRSAATVARLAHVYARMGQTAEAQILLAELTERSATEPVSAYSLATVQAGLGNAEQAVQHLAEEERQRSRAILNLSNDPFFDTLRQNPDFQALVSSLSLPDN